MLAAFARGEASRAPSWVTDLLVAEHYHMSPDDVEAMPEWLFQRAVLWLDVVAQVRNERSESG